MGCTDQVSNFQTMVFDQEDGKWWCESGPVMYKCPDLEVLKQALAWSVSRGSHWNVTYNQQHQSYEAVPGEGSAGVFVQA